MNSAEIRSLVQGDQTRPHLVIGFARRHWAGLFTRWSRPGGKWGHTALWDEERGVFNEALMFEGTVETPQHKWFGKWSAFELIAVPVPDPQAGVRWAREHVGTPYDYRGAYAAWLRGDWQDDRRLYCSEKETLALMAAGWHPFRDAPRYGVHPHDLYRVIPQT